MDHLYIDQNAWPTLVEVKRSKDTRIRREVVGQMMDYAAEKSAMMSTVGAPAEYDDLNVGEVEAAYTSTRMFSNSVMRHKRRMMEKESANTEPENADTEDSK